MFAFWSVNGRITRLPYAIATVVTFFVPQLAILAIQPPADPTLPVLPPGGPFAPWLFYLLPIHFSLVLAQTSRLVLLCEFLLMMGTAWTLAALAFRRANDAGVAGWPAVWVIAPVLQIPVILWLSFLPSVASQAAQPGAAKPATGDQHWPAAVQGVLAGIVLTVVVVAIGTLLFGSYGNALFILLPFVVGAITAYLANRRADIGWQRTLGLIAVATILGALSLLVFALEGAICIIAVTPLAIGCAAFGGILGRALARSGRRNKARDSLMGVALLPLALAVELVLPPSFDFSTDENIEVKAPPAEVWRALVHMQPITEQPILLFRLGVAYPIRGDVIGEGIGAVRHGVFSTGTATERVKEWQPERKLAFVVLDQVPAMHELSPYHDLQTPHLTGYFSTTYTSFTLLPLPNGGTRVVEHTEHQLRLDPVLYWLPLVRWMIHENNSRVLRHIRHQAELAAKR